ncbi:MAG TPA: hypothetical protein VFC78_01695 [Tepidisphaeraceae bacterium]|nr:hypothetical protein [Tepidisphaeraceae bacterium]
MKHWYIALLLTLATAASCFAGNEHHYLYLTTPDGAQGGGSGVGLMVFDIDQGHKLVNRIDVPSFREGVRGVCANAKTRRIYVTTTSRRIVCLDLMTNAGGKPSAKVAWQKQYDTGCDRLAITPDGKTLYVPCGWWTTQKTWLVVDAKDGRELSRIATPAAGHNTLVSLDGSRAYLASNSWLSVVDTKTNAVLREIKSNSRNFFPFTINADHSRAYVCLGQEVGFEVMDPHAGKILETVYPDGPRQNHRTHGIGLTPDEKEIWIAIQGDSAIYVFDNTANPPTQKARLEVSKAGHGWIGFSRDGHYAYTSSVEVFDAKTKKVAAILKDEMDKPVCGSKFVEVDFKDGQVSAVGDQFGVGRKSTQPD